MSIIYGNGFDCRGLQCNFEGGTENFLKIQNILDDIAENVALLNDLCESSPFSKIKVIKDFGKYKIIEWYANTDHSENGINYYGDIFTTKDDVLEQYPDTIVLTGYGIIDKTGLSVSETKDWYHCIEDAENDLKNL